MTDRTAEQERAAVVAWLRSEAPLYDADGSLALQIAANAIERGDHIEHSGYAEVRDHD